MSCYRRALTQLQVLDLLMCGWGNSNLTSACVPSIALFVGLKELHVNSVVCNEGLEHLAGSLLQLEALVVNGGWATHNKISDDGMVTISSSFPMLRRLEVCGSAATSFGLQRMAATLRHLTHITLCRCNVTDVSLEHLGSLTELRELILSINYDVTGSGLRMLSPVKHLSKLELTSTNMKNESVNFLLVFKELRHLSLGCCVLLSPSGLTLLSQIHGLHTLTLASLYSLTDCVLMSFGSSLHQLRVIDLTYCTAITNGGVAGLLLALQRLEFIDVSGCANITDEAMEPIESLRASPCLDAVGANFSGISEECAERLQTMFVVNVENCCF
jgi:hypothetical protein